MPTAIDSSSGSGPRPDALPSEEALLATVRGFVLELHPHLDPARIDLDASLDRDLGIDSLGRMELGLRLERRFRVSLGQEAMSESESPRDLLRAVLAGETRARDAIAEEVVHHEGLGSERRPDRAQTLLEVLDWHVDAHPDRVHLHLYDEHDERETLTYAALKEGAEGVARGVRELGLPPGHAVAIMLPTCIDYFHCFLGILLAGGIPVPMYPPARASQIEDHVRRHAQILANARVRVLITFAQAKPVAMLLRSQVDELRRVVTADDLKRSAGPPISPIKARPEDIAFLQYTSGSTGNPKGVILTHANILANIRAMDRALEASTDDVFVSWLPLYHDMGLIGAWMGSLYVGFTLVLMSPLAFLSRPSRWLRTIHNHRGTVSGGPNFAFELCTTRIDDAELEGVDLSSWRYAFNGAEPVNADTLRRFTQRFAAYRFEPAAVAPVYGLAEATLGLCFPPPGRGLLVDRIEREALAVKGRAVATEATDAETLEVVACGQPMPGYEARIVDDAGRELPERMQGRLELKGPSTTSGYYRNPEATRALFDGEWLDSGDLAYIAQGDLYLTGREKDLIIKAGRNLYPYELEQAVGELPGVRKGCVAVFAAKDATARTERIVVVAEVRDRDIDERALEQRINDLALTCLGLPADDVVLAAPRSVLKTSSGKIRRSATAELYARGQLGGSVRSPWLQYLRMIGAGLAPGCRQIARRVGELAFGTWAWTTSASIGLLTWATVMLAPTPSMRWRALTASGRAVLLLTGVRVDLIGAQQLPKDGPFVLVSNHQSYLDAAVLMTLLPRHVSFVTKAELASTPIGEFLRRAGCQFVERFDTKRSVEDARRMAAVLRSGLALGYFPEGTFKRMPGLLPFHMGAFLTAAETGVAVVPVAIRGLRSILREGSWLPRRGAARITVCEPIPARAPIAADQAWDGALALRNAVREEILERCGEPDLGLAHVEKGG